MFANVYMNLFDHFVKEVLHVKYYVRYTDDFIMVHENPVALVSLLPPMRTFLKEQLILDLHPRKIELRKLDQGVDFLGYVILHKYKNLRAKTEQRMLYRVEKDGLSRCQLYSCIGLLSHCEGYEMKQRLRQIYVEEHF
ncbi:RNA-directed DNA polymerase [Patescibacteria group bacterium]|nr:RNA-directed DNA polymerase [Patescibacteria group bacterium]